MSPSWVNGKLDLLKVSVNCSSNRFYGYFHPCSTFIKFGLVRRKSRCVYYGSLKHSIIQKLLWTAVLICFTKTSICVIHPSRFSGIQRNMHFLHYGLLENLIFQMLTGTAEIPRFMTTSMSVVHSVSFALYRQLKENPYRPENSFSTFSKNCHLLISHKILCIVHGWNFKTSQSS